MTTENALLLALQVFDELLVCAPRRDRNVAAINVDVHAQLTTASRLLECRNDRIREAAAVYFSHWTPLLLGQSADESMQAIEHWAQLIAKWAAYDMDFTLRASAVAAVANAGPCLLSSDLVSTALRQQVLTALIAALQDEDQDIRDDAALAVADILGDCASMCASSALQTLLSHITRLLAAPVTAAANFLLNLIRFGAVSPGPDEQLRNSKPYEGSGMELFQHEDVNVFVHALAVPQLATKALLRLAAQTAASGDLLFAVTGCAEHISADLLQLLSSTAKQASPKAHIKRPRVWEALYRHVLALTAACTVLTQPPSRFNPFTAVPAVPVVLDLAELLWLQGALPPLLAHACQQLVRACTPRRAHDPTPLDRLYAALLLASIANLAAAGLGPAVSVEEHDDAADDVATDEIDADADAGDDWGLPDAPQVAIDDPFSPDFDSLFTALPEPRSHT